MNKPCIAHYCPDGNLIAMFVLDDDQLEPTQRLASNAFALENTSEFCYRREFRSLSDFRETL